MKSIACICACIGSLMIGSESRAQDIGGDWQGRLELGTRSLRFLLQVTGTDAGGWSASMVSLDEGGFDQPIPASSVVLRDSVVTITFPWVRSTYQGKLNPDGKSIGGTYTQRRAWPLSFVRATRETAWRDPSPHTARFVAVDSNVKLEVLDWGGSGKPIVLLSGLGNTAHIFDQFAPKLTADYHVYGITRRGFGFSSAPASGYTAERLADDVLAVLDTLGLNRPVLIGHSIAGQELSSIGSRYPNRVAGLIYLDAAYAYAYYDISRGNLAVDLADVRRKLEQVATARTNPSSLSGVTDVKALVQELLNTSLPMLATTLQEYERTLESTPVQSQPTSPTPPPPYASAAQAIWAGVQKHSSIRAPVLAIYALPRQIPRGDRTDPAADSLRRAVQAEAFQKGVPSARVVRLPRATHYLFLSNEPDVLRELHAFIKGLR